MIADIDRLAVHGAFTESSTDSIGPNLNAFHLLFTISQTLALSMFMRLSTAGKIRAKRPNVQAALSVEKQYDARKAVKEISAWL